MGVLRELGLGVHIVPELLRQLSVGHRPAADAADAGDSDDLLLDVGHGIAFSNWKNSKRPRENFTMWKPQRLT